MFIQIMNEWRADYMKRNHRYIGELAHRCDPVFDPKCPTAAHFYDGATPRIVWGPAVRAMPKEQQQYILKHEVLHFIRGDISKLKIVENVQIANICMDGLLNYMMDEQVKLLRKHGASEMEIDSLRRNWDLESQNGVGPKSRVTMDPRYTGEHEFFEYYEWYMENNEDEDGSGGTGKPSDEESDGGSKVGPVNGPGKPSGKSPDDGSGGGSESENFDDHEYRSDWANPEASDEVKAEVWKEIECQTRNRGYAPSPTMDVLLELLKSKPKNEWLDKVRKVVARVMGRANPSQTWSRLNRRGFRWKKGKIKQGSEIAIIIDTSGSMCGTLELVVPLLLCEGYILHMIPVDTSVHTVHTITKPSEFKPSMLVGGGGTEIQPGIDYARDNLKTLGTFVVTDGYCEDNLTFYGKKNVLLTTTGTVPTLHGDCTVIEM